MPDEQDKTILPDAEPAAEPMPQAVAKSDPIPEAVADQEPVADPVPSEHVDSAPLPESGPYDATNPGEFGPTVVLLHLERDGVVVEGYIDPYTGEGTHNLLIALQNALVKARSKEDGAAPAAPGTILVGETPDPNALKRQRAAAAGHDSDPETKHCRICHNAEWWCLDGNPCNPRDDLIPSLIEEPVHGETEGEAA